MGLYKYAELQGFALRYRFGKIIYIERKRKTVQYLILVTIFSVELIGKLNKIIDIIKLKVYTSNIFSLQVG